MKTENNDLRNHLLSEQARNQAIIDKKKIEFNEKLALFPYQIFHLKEQNELHILGGRKTLGKRLIKKVAKENGISNYSLEENEVKNREQRPLQFKYNHYVLKY